MVLDTQEGFHSKLPAVQLGDVVGSFEAFRACELREKTFASVLAHFNRQPGDELVVDEGIADFLSQVPGADVDYFARPPDIVGTINGTEGTVEDRLLAEGVTNDGKHWYLISQLKRFEDGRTTELIIAKAGQLKSERFLRPNSAHFSQ